VHRFYYALLLVALLAGCSQEALMEKFSSPEDRALAKGYIDLLRAHKFDDIENALDGSIKSPTAMSTLIGMADLIPNGEPTAIKVVGAQSFRENAMSRVNTTFEYTFGDKWVVINVAVLSNDGKKTIVGFNVYPRSQSLEDQNRFSLIGKSGLQYVALIATAIAALLSLYALVLCIRTKLTGRKWVWIIFIALGFGRFAVNWSTGQWNFAPLTVQLFSALAFAPFYGPWTISFSLPIGAIAFLLRRTQLTRPTVS
jgi:hypothetical protein